MKMGWYDCYTTRLQANILILTNGCQMKYIPVTAGTFPNIVPNYAPLPCRSVE
jgi:hypothetical protein